MRRQTISETTSTYDVFDGIGVSRKKEAGGVGSIYEEIGAGILT